MFCLHLQIQQTDHIEKTSAIRWFKWIVAPQRMNADLQRDQQLARYLTSKEFQSNETQLTVKIEKAWWDQSCCCFLREHSASIRDKQRMKHGFAVSRNKNHLVAFP